MFFSLATMEIKKSDIIVTDNTFASWFMLKTKQSKPKNMKINIFFEKNSVY